MKILVLSGLLAAALLGPQQVYAHCDGLDGPVVKAARQALDTGNVNIALIWVQSSADRELREAFTKARAARKLDSNADVKFFETLVRLHRAGEGEPYTGLKPAGRDLGPAIPAADKAVESGSVEALAKMFPDSTGLRERFQKVMAHKNFAKSDVAAGREYVEAYVELLHYVEGHQAGHSHD